MDIEPLPDRWSRVFQPKDRRPIYEWAFDKYECAPPMTITGPFRVERSRHFIGPLDSLHNDRKREVSVRAPVRSMKTGIGEIFVAHVADQYPGETMWVTGKATLADLEWERFEKQLLASPKLRHLLPASTPQGSRRNKQSGLVELTNGSSLFMHGNAELNLQQKPIRYAIHDEVWEWEPGRLAESYGRIGDYLRMGISKVLNISQGGDDESDWDAVYRQGHCAEWEVECQGCHQYFQPIWSHHTPDGKRAGMRWDEHKDANGLWVIQRVLDSIRYECPFCSHPHTDTTRTKGEWNRTGRYTVTNPDARPEKDSFHWTAVIDFPWRELVDLYLQAINAWKQGNTAPLIKFFQKRMAENKSISALLESVMHFKRMDYDLRSKWDDECARFMTVDVQELEMWGTIRQWSKDGKSRKLWFGKLFSWADIEKRREEFAVKPKLTGIDCGHNPKGDKGVWAACVRHGWLAMRGDDEKVFTIEDKNTRIQQSFSEIKWRDPEIGQGPNAGKRCPTIHFSSETMADRLDGLISSGMWIEPPEIPGDKMDEQYRHQMAGEYKVKVQDPVTNKVKFKRAVSKKWGNHAYDCAKMQVLFATISGILPDLVS